MKSKKWIIISILSIIVCAYSILSLVTDIFNSYRTLNIIMLVILFIIGIFLLKFALSISNLNLTPKDKLYKYLIQDSDTVYIMLNSKNNSVVYTSNNIEDILGIKNNDRSNEDIINQTLGIPVIKNEINNWDKMSNYVSSMVQYDNPKYNYQMWIRIKIYPYKDKKNEYYVMQIIDATKEHERQHLLISQATNIKMRENTLNQITSKSYAFEININLTRNFYDLKYFKKDKLYFGEEKRGIYTEGLNDILNYVNKNDRDLVYSNLNIDSLKEHFEKYELDSISVRYRIGNELKNNTWLESTIFFIIDNQKQYVSVLTKNVTESAESIREQNILLQNALNETRVISKSKTELISTISHDIRIPLTNIIGLSDTLLSDNISLEAKDDVKNINDAAKDIVNIIDGLLDPSGVEKKLIQKEEKNYSIYRMFSKIETSAKEYIGEKSIRLNFNLDNNLPVILYGDCDRITRSLNEIINNAIKYTNEGTIDINVRGEKIGDSVKIIVEIKDPGKGIDEQKLNTIMLDTSNKGITSVKRLMELLDGKLEIESKVDEYTKVTVSYIQKIVEDNKIREIIKNNREAEKFSLKGNSVLVVDDNNLNLKVTKRILDSYDLDVTLLNSGQECIESIKEGNTFDLILMDRMMPGLSGIDTMNELRKINGFSIPIVVLTADAMQGQKEKYLDLGFDDYLSKPIDKNELSRVLKKFLKNQK